MARAHTSDRTGKGAVYETDAAAVSVRPRSVDGGRSALEYAIESEHPAPIRVRVRQPIPDSIDFADLGFPGDCGEDWERDGDGLVLDRAIDPETTVRTAWGVDGDLGADLEPPVVEAAPVTAGDASTSVLSDTLPEFDDASSDNSGSSDDTGSSGNAGSNDGTGSNDDTESPADESLDLDLEESTPLDASHDEDAPLREAESEKPAGTDAEIEEVPDLADLSVSMGAEERSTSAESERRADAEQHANADPDDVEPEGVGGAQAMPPTGDAGRDGADESTEVATSSSDATGDATGDVDEEPAGDAADSLVHRLVEELHDDELDERHRAALADALEVRLADSTNAFVEYVRERQRRRTERLGEEIEAVEESVEGLYGLKADASEVATLKRAITKLDDAKAAESELRALRSRLDDLAEETADADTVSTLQGDHESLVESVATTDDELAELEVETTDAREEIRSDLDAVVDDLATLRDAAATAATVDELSETVADLEDDAATGNDLEALREEVESVEARLDERIDLLDDRHDELAADAATDSALDSHRERHRDRLNELTSEVQTLRDDLEAEYSTDDEIGTELDRRAHRSLAHLVAFAVGLVGLVSTVPLAIAGSLAAAVTFLGGAGTLVLWWRSVGREELAEEGFPSLRALLGR